MTIRFRRSLKIAPGLRVNFNKNSTSLSLGPRGAHYTVSTSGRKTISAGIPGTGLYAYESIGPQSAKHNSSVPKSAAQQRQAAAQPSPKPSLFSSGAEKAFYEFLKDIYDTDHKYSPHEIVEKAKALSEQYDSLMYPLNLLSFVHILSADEYQDKLIDAGGKLWAARESAFNDPIVRKYFVGIFPVVPICEGISTRGIFDLQQLGFIWVEVLQNKEKYNEALSVLHEMEPTQLVAISMADVELSMKDYSGALDTTSDITNEDDVTLILLVLRGIAFREQEMFDAYLECLKQALAKKSRAKEALHRAHFERSITYQKMHKFAAAKKDLEMILVDDPTNSEVLERIGNLDK